jgi:RNA polymerase sigma-70 factor (ECF subfamily)
MRSDEDLMRNVSDGHFEAFEELIRRHQKTAVGLAHKLLNNPDRAEEVAQEAFLKILRNAEDYEATASFRTYLARVVSRLCYDITDKNKPSTLNPESKTNRSDQQSNPLEQVLKQERQQAVQRALNSLPERQRVAIVLQNFEDFTYEEIADTLETTKKAVERLLARARKQLHSALKESPRFDNSFKES